MLSIPLPADIEKRLVKAAKQAKKTKINCVLEVIVNYLEDLEDTRIALSRLKNPGKRLSSL